MNRFCTVILSLTFLIGVALEASAQQPPPGMPGMDPAKMQEMMKKFQDPEAMARLQKQAAAASECMEGIDRAEIEALQAKAEKARAEIDRLCSAGQKDAALKHGLKLSRELRSDATVKQLRECSKPLGDSMQGMPWAQTADIDELKNDTPPTASDICS